MRRAMTVLLLLVAILLGNAAGAQDAVTPAERARVEEVITAQIHAFRHDDATTAFSFAAPSIKAMFGDAPHFMAMVQQAYPLVYNQQSFSFGTSTIDHGLLIQKVQFLGANGDEALALYTMEKEPDGKWRIAGCSLIKSGDREI
jgi:ketosteroid isomerase-like protein